MARTLDAGAKKQTPNARGSVHWTLVEVKDILVRKGGIMIRSIDDLDRGSFNPVYSNQGYNSFYGPGYLGIHGALRKKVILPWFGDKAGSTLTMGIEGSNIINRANLTEPASTDLNSVSSFGLGVAQGANQARILQLMAKFRF